MATEKQIPKLAAMLVEHQKDLGVLSSDDAQWAINNGHEAIELFVGAVKNYRDSGRLSYNKAITLPACKRPFSPYGYYQTHGGLHVCNQFRNWLIRVAPPIESVPKIKIFVFDLNKPSNNLEIRAKLPMEYVFEDASMFCAYLGGMIDCQPNEKKGNLLSNGNANMFYVRELNSALLTVGVYWDVGNKEWNVRAYPNVYNQWNAGCRVFSAAA